jgi:uncharacterized membrane protein (DUF106 family)
MTKEEWERLEKDHKFYESISELEPDQVNKQVKDYYEQRSKLFKSQKHMEKIGFRFGCSLLIFLAVIVAIFIFLALVGWEK